MLRNVMGPPLAHKHDEEESVPPAMLWHYTDANGLYGIVSTSQMYFGDIQMMNDRSERLYGEALLDEVLAEQKLDVLDEYDLRNDSIRLYVLSFSERADSISQWQRYGAGGLGYCIGFVAEELDSFLKPPIYLKRMLYDPVEQKSILLRALQSGQDLDDALENALVQIKNPHFSDEREWRYIVTVEACPEQSLADPKEIFAIRGGIIKPFVALPLIGRRGLQANKNEGLPIASIVCGPRLDADVAIPATSRFLKSYNYWAVDVQRSMLADVWR
jgi:hypothetical protein